MIDAKVAKKILSRLPELVVELDPNPTARGPVYLQTLISTTRGFLNETGVMIQTVLRVMSTQEMDLDAKKTVFQIESDELMATNKQVSSLPAVRDREAMINVLLRAQRKEILLLGRDLRESQHIEKAVRHRHRELEQTMSAIRLQRSLVQAELKTGSFYGDESGNTTPSEDKEPELNESELGSIFEDIEAEGLEEEEDTPGETSEEVIEDSDPDVSVDVLSILEFGDINLDDNPPPEKPKRKAKKPKAEPDVEQEVKKVEVRADFNKFNGDATLSMGEDVLEDAATEALTSEEKIEDDKVDPDITRFLDEEESDDFADIFG